MNYRQKTLPEGLKQMTQDVSLAPAYDFVRLCNISRLVQLGCLVLQIFLIYSELSNLSYLEFFFYIALCGGSFYVVFTRWHNAIDGRFDLRQLLNEKNLSRRAPYAAALFSAVILAFFIWSSVELENGFVNFLFYLSAAINFGTSLGLLGLEIYEVFVLKNA